MFVIRKSKPALFFIILTLLAGYAGGQTINVNGVFSNSITRDSLNLISSVLTINGQSNLFKGKFILTGKNDFTFSFSNLPTVTRNARVTVSFIGFKDFSINIPEVTFRNGSFTYNAGQFELKKETFSSIVNILHRISKKEEMNIFDITFKNVTSEKYLITKIIVNSLENTAEAIQCDLPSPDIPIFEIHDTIIIELVSKHKAVVNGSYSDKGGIVNLETSIKGEIGYNACKNYNYLRLNLPCDFIIRSADFTKISIKIPEKYKYLSLPNSLNEFGGKESTIKCPSHFKMYEFIFITNDNKMIKQFYIIG